MNGSPPFIRMSSDISLARRLSKASTRAPAKDMITHRSAVDTIQGSSRAMKRAILVMWILVIGCMAVAAAQQTQDTNPGRSPDVFLDNHRPLIQKKDKAPTSRTVSGHVVDDAGTPLDGALVTLTDA